MLFAENPFSANNFKSMFQTIKKKINICAAAKSVIIQLTHLKEMST